MVTQDFQLLFIFCFKITIPFLEAAASLEQTILYLNRRRCERG